MGTPMHWPHRRTTLFFASLLGAMAIGVGARIGSPPSLMMSKLDDRGAGKIIETGTRFAAAECRGQADAARDLCMAESPGLDRDIAKAKCGERAATLGTDCLRVAGSAKGGLPSDSKLPAR